jgi:hypothetical protein
MAVDLVGVLRWGVKKIDWNLEVFLICEDFWAPEFGLYVVGNVGCTSLDRVRA